MKKPRALPPAIGTTLRRRAEEQLRVAPPASDAVTPLLREEAQRQIHELQVHQLELDIQNEELRQAHAELEAAAEKYADLYDSAPVSYLTLDAMGDIREANLTAAHYLGVNRGQLIGRRFGLFVAHESRTAFKEFLHKSCADDAQAVCEVSLVIGDATPRRARLEGRVAACAGNGRACRVVVIDITRLAEADAEIRGLFAESERTRLALVEIVEERARAEMALRESEARFRSLFEQPVVGVAQVAPDGRWLDVNQRLCEIVGYTREELLALTFQDITHPEDLDADLDCVRRLLTGELRTYSLEKRYIRKDGSLVWIHLTLSVVRGKSLLPEYFVSVVEEIHEQKLAEVARRLAEEKFRSIFEHAVEGIFQSTPEGRYVTVNPAFSRILGYHSPEELIRHCDDIGRQIYASLADRERFKQLMAACGVVSGLEHEARRKDGSTAWVSLNGRAVRDAAGQVVLYEGSIVDITERKQAEAVLRDLSGRILKVQDEERCRIARELHDTTAQSLAAIAMNLSVLRQVAGTTDERAEKLLTDCDELVSRSVREVRTLSYLLHPPMLEEFGLARAVREYAEGFAQRSGIRVELDLAGDMGRLPCDAELSLFRVLQESLGNVHRHSGSATAAIRLARAADTVTLEVRDAGRGLPPPTPDGAHGGVVLGVGIAGMCQRLRQLGGRLEVEAGLPGIIVRATLPMKQEEA